MKRIAIICVFLLLYLTGQGQADQVDSLKQQGQDDSLKQQQLGQRDVLRQLPGPDNVLEQQIRDNALADQFFREGDYAKAAELYGQLYANEKSQRNYDRLLNVLIQLKKFNEAEELIIRQTAAAPHNYRYQMDLGNLYKKSGNPEKARSRFEAILKHLPDENHLISGIAYSLYNYGENELALEVLQKARQRSDDPTAFSFELARLYYLNKQPSGMIHELLSLVERRPEYLQNIKGQLQFYLQDDKDFALLEEMLEKRIKRNAANPVYSQLLIWRLLQQEEFGKALDLALAMDKNEEQGEYLLQIAGICSANQAYSAAARAYNYLMEKGPESPWYRMARMHFLDAKRKHVLSGNFKAADLETLEEGYEALLQDFGKNAATAPVLQQLALLKGRYMDKIDEALLLLEETITLTGDARFRAECKLELGDLYILADDVWEATLLYGQVEKEFKDNPIGQEARFRNARLSYYIGEFEWALGQLNVLKSATSQLMANDALNLSLLISENPGPDSTYAALRMYAGAELLAFRHLPAKALAALDSIHTRFPGHALHDDILMAKAGIFIQQGQKEEAAGAWLKVIENYGNAIWADDALFKLGALYEDQLKDTSKAMEYYEKLLLQHPGSLYVTEARKRFRTLRGDLPPAENEEFINEPVRF